MFPRTVVASLLLLVPASVAPAQCLGPHGYGFGYYGRHFSVAGPLGPWGFGGGWGPPLSCLAPGPRYYGFGIAPTSSITIVVNPPPVVVVPSRPAPPIEETDEIGVFRPNPGGVAALRPRPAPPPPVVEPAPRRPAAPMPPPDDPAGLIDLGRDAFAAGQFGRAAERFQRAAQLAPLDPVPRFLLAAARFAAGKFAEAVADLNDGLKLTPGRPKIKTRDLYRGNDALFDDHLNRLKTAAERNPDDVTLRYLYAVELWLDGRRDEARAIFQQLLPRVADPAPVQRFLDAPGGDVVQR